MGKKKLILLFTISLFVILLFVRIPLKPKDSLNSSNTAQNYRQLVEHWSHVIYQSTEQDEDYITNFDFDGNFNGYDNWEYFYCSLKFAYVYYSIIESTSHYFINYNFFHPKDLGNPVFVYVSAHENDFEGCRVIIEKDGTDWGHLIRLETMAHFSLFFYNEYHECPR